MQKFTIQNWSLTSILVALAWSLLMPGPVLAQSEDDFDGDGIPNQQDLCPHSNQGNPIDRRGCEYDQDGDGAVDVIDQCPGSDAGMPVNIRGCGHDSDLDQVVDFRDACPNTEPATRVDATGCELGDTMRLPGLVFAKGSSTLNRRAKSVLDRAANTLFKYPELKVEVAGYSDSKGDSQRNRALSQERANSVRTYLLSLGITASRVSARGYGDADPIAGNDSAAGRAANRRVVLKLKT